MNVRMILKGIKSNPLAEFLEELEQRHRASSAIIMYNDVGLYVEGYAFYYLTLERLLTEMSLARRFQNGPYYALKYGAKYTPQEQKLAKRFRETDRYFDLDFLGFLILSRILIDRTIALSKYFLTGESLPSFVSFNRHKKFFQNPSNRPYGKHEKYAQYVCDETAWFDETLKPVRDKFLVHPQQNHVKLYGLPDSGASEIEMVIFIPSGTSGGSQAKFDLKRVSIVKLIENIQDFLRFFGNYGNNILKGENTFAI